VHCCQLLSYTTYASTVLSKIVIVRPFVVAVVIVMCPGVASLAVFSPKIPLMRSLLFAVTKHLRHTCDSAYIGNYNREALHINPSITSSSLSALVSFAEFEVASYFAQQSPFGHGCALRSPCSQLGPLGWCPTAISEVSKAWRLFDTALSPHAENSAATVAVAIHVMFSKWALCTNIL
jgi:hypothetical protein